MSHNSNPSLRVTVFPLRPRDVRRLEEMCEDSARVRFETWEPLKPVYIWFPTIDLDLYVVSLRFLGLRPFLLLH